VLRITALLAVALATAFPVSARAQNNDATPSVTIMLVNANELMKDVDDILIKVANDPKQAKVVRGYMEDVFLLGVDPAKPVRIDLILGDKRVFYRSSFPISHLTSPKRDGFLDNLDAFGITNKKLRTNYYKLSGAFAGWLRYKDGYAIIAEREEDVPLGIEDPRKDLAPLLEKKYDAALLFRNTATKPDALAARKKAFQSVREEALAALKPKEGEPKEDFALRKLAAQQQMNELERFYVESEELVMGWTTAVPKGWMDIQLRPIPGTSLEQAVKQLGVQPSYFANIKLAEKPVLNGRVNHPLDEMRQKQFSEFFAELETSLKAKTDSRSELSAEDKTSRKKAVEIVIGMLDRGAKGGLVDGFIDMHEAQGGKKTIVAGVKAADMDAAVDLVQILPAAKLADKVDTNVDEAGAVKIHAVVVPKNDQANFRDFFGTDTFYVGTGPESLWYAAGANALEELKAAIAKVGETPMPKPEGDTPFVDLMVKVGPWLELRDKQKAKEQKAGPTTTAKKTDEEAKKEQDRNELRKLALETFAKQGEDYVSLQLRRTGNQVEGNLTTYPGILRFVGAAVAKFSRETLE
jgi:hypothetical protein